jgi:glyoxylase-like metal-dependent hydrolase (beta-lactamase superfamily II)
MNHPLNRFVPSLRPLRLAAALLAATLSTAAVGEVTSPVLAINEATAKAEVLTRPLRGGVSVLEGAGGNIGVLATPAGLLLVDAGISVARPRLEAALKAISPAAPKWVINTHWHWDHTDGNPWLAEAGATIVAHENTRKYLAKRTGVIEWGYSFPALPASGLPTVVYRTEKTIEFGGETVRLKNFGTGHSDGDSIVYLAKADVLFMGDVWWNGHYPFIDYGAGGGIDGMIRWTRQALALSGPDTLIVPGHGPVGTRTELQQYLDMLVDVRAQVARLKRQGRSLAQIVESRPTARYDARWGAFVLNPAFFTQLVYMGV